MERDVIYWRETLKLITLGQLNIHLIWFDSMGAKSSSLLIETPDIKILVDPGAAEMQPSYPLPNSEKQRLRQEALDNVKRAAQKADIIFISHYHYDHHTLPQEAREIYKDKQLWIKDPNLWINRSQWGRARLFLSQIYEAFEGKSLETYQPPKKDIRDPLAELPLAASKDFKDYQQRKRELIKKGRAWFESLTALWQKEPWVAPTPIKGKEVLFVDGMDFETGATKVRFTKPLFHGAEYDRVGWVVGLVLEHGGRKIIYASDLQGPIIEDYADWIIREDPQILILDGPATYLLGYMLNQINLQRVIDNACSIIQNINPQITIYDRHLTRDTLFKERIAKVYQTAESYNRVLITAAEWFREEPLILKIK
jgi:hypothetical protein